MKAIMLMFDSLNRHMLSAYGNDETITPNFTRLAEKCVTFDKSYVGSLPCMPARRELHTGRHNFLHRSWGPMEPYDDSTFEILKNNGVHTHLVSDHMHYWEDGGATYHTKYSTWEVARGQEGDPWKPRLSFAGMPEKHMGQLHKQEMANREYMKEHDLYSQKTTYALGLEFLENNWQADNWYLQIETFDPHEPFFAPDDCRKLYRNIDEDALHFDWPFYAPVSDEEAPHVQQVRQEYFASLTLCDRCIGKVLDFMDEHNMWEDTMLIVNTDHGYLLGEHGWWAKANDINFYEEVSHTPLFIYDPRSKATGRCSQLVQTTDLAPTILDYFNMEIPKDMTGKVLKDTIARNKPAHEALLWGIHSAQLNCTDGRYVYTLAPNQENEPLYEYTLMPTHMKHAFYVEELQTMEVVEPFSFTKGCKVMKIKDLRMGMSPKEHHFKTMLFDLETDPFQQNPIRDEAVESRLRKQMVRMMQEDDAPMEQYERYGLTDLL